MPRIAAGALWLLPVCLCAQWLNYREKGVPRLKDGKVNLSAPAPRTADGKPDLTCVWMHEVTPAAEMKRLYGKIIENTIQVEAPEWRSAPNTSTCSIS